MNTTFKELNDHLFVSSSRLMTADGTKPVEFEVPDILRLRLGALGERLPIVFVEGELDLSGAETFERALREASAGGGAVIVDLSACSFIDSTGLSALIRAASPANGGGGRLAICGVAGQVRRTFQLTDVGRVIRIFQTPDEAVRVLGTP